MALSFVIFTSAFLLTSCGKKEVEEEQVARPVRVLVLEEAQAGFQRTYPGTVQALDSAEVSFLVEGEVVDFPIQRGQELKRGDFIAQIDPRDLENSLAAENAKVVEGEADLNRYRELYENDVVPIAELQIKQTRYDVAVAEMRIAEKALEDATLRAPFDGVVATKYIDTFDRVEAKQAVIRLQNISKLQVRIDIPERDMASAPGTKKEKGANIQASAFFDAVPGREFEMTLKDWETQADPDTQTFMVRFLLLPPTDVTLLPGMSANVKVNILSRGATANKIFIIPSNAVFADEAGQAHVWVVNPEDLAVQSRAVQLGEVTGTEDIQILEGLESDEMIVITAIRHLQEGMKIQPREVGVKITR